MIYFFIPLILITLYKITFHFKEYNREYMSKESTNCIKGIFIIIVFFSHIRQYQTYDALIDKPVIKILTLLGQLMVTMFMFYSGFGIYESIKKKKESYVKQIPKRRVLKVMFDLAIAIITFIICNLFINEKYSLKDNLLAFTGWSSVGNSNWYIFSIVSLYLITFISFSIFKKKNSNALILNTILAIIFIAGISFARPSYWVNTCICYVAGMWYSYYLDKINIFFGKHQKIYYLIFVIILAIFAALFNIKDQIAIYSIMSVFFCLVIVLATMRVNVNNKILTWFGTNLFWIYVLQRIPMRVLEKLRIDEYNKYIYFGLCFGVTMLIVYLYSKFVPSLEKIVLREKQNK